LRRLILAGLALLVVPALAFAGATATDGTDTLKIKAKVEPAKASKKNKPRPVALTFDYWAGTTDDSRLPDVRSVSIFAGGAVSAYDAFPKCDESELVDRGPSACPDGSEVGSGKSIAEVHSPDSTTTKTDVPADVLVFNALIETDRNGGPLATPRDGILFYAEVAGSKLALPFEAEDGNRRITYYNPVDDPDPSADALYTVKEVHVTFPRQTVRKNGKRIPWLAAPRKCRKSWLASATNDRYEGGKLTATHKVKCKKAGA
jgi:hypothetical protein